MSAGRKVIANQILEGWNKLPVPPTQVEDGALAHNTCAVTVVFVKFVGARPARVKNLDITFA